MSPLPKSSCRNKQARRQVRPKLSIVSTDEDSPRDELSLDDTIEMNGDFRDMVMAALKEELKINPDVALLEQGELFRLVIEKTIDRLDAPEPLA